MSPESSTNWYALEEADPISSPALLVYPDRIDANLRLMIQMVGGDPSRLWPHVKTSKCQSIIERMVAHGIRRFKGATLAELEIAANAGASDLLLAMQPHASMAHRLLDLATAHDSVQTHTLVDCMPSLQMLDQLTQERHQSLTIWIDLDVGMHRTGIAPGPEVVSLLEALDHCPKLRFGGWHAYDGHLHQPSVSERQKACQQWVQSLESWWAGVPRLQDKPQPLIAGGTPTFPMHATRPDSICSPGTSVLWDAGYASHFPDLEFQWACVLMGRVVSKPAEGILCLDLGHKSVASEMPHPRLHCLNLRVDRFVGHSEEHLVVSSEEAHQKPVGAVIYAIPWHVCPTVALHQELYRVESHRASGKWPVEARQRRLKY